MIRRIVISFLLSAAPAMAETVVHGWIPSRILRQGQVQLVDENERVQLEVLLHSRFMDRVVNTIVEKEKKNWGNDHADAASYIEQLKRARESVRIPDGPESLMIVFSLRPAPGEIAWYTGEVDHQPEAWRMKEPRLLARLEASRDYVMRNAGLILEDSLGVDPSTIKQLQEAP